MSIGENIKRARGHMKQSELADLLNVDVSTVSRWENGKNIPHGDTLRKIAVALKTTGDELLGENDRPEISTKQPTILQMPQGMSLSEKVADKNTDMKEPITVNRRNNMYIIKNGEHELCIPDNPTGHEIFLTLARSMLKNMGLSETSSQARQNINNGTPTIAESINA